MNRLNTPGPTPAGGPEARPVGVLIVDDDEGIRGLLAAGLWQHGFAVWAAAGGAEAVAVYQSSRASIDVALLDVLMPGCDGPRTLAALREHDPGIRACFMTGFTGDYTEQGLLALGALAVFQKPLRLDALARSLADLTPRPVPTPPAGAPPDRDEVCASGAGDRPPDRLPRSPRHG